MKQERFVADLLHYHKLVDDLDTARWRWGHTQGVHSRQCWTADLTSVELWQQMWRTISAQGYELEHITAYRLNHNQTQTRLESEPVPRRTWQWHPQIQWNTHWHGATIIDGDRVEYEPNLLIAYDSWLPQTHEAPVTPDIVRTTVEFTAWRVI